MIQLTCQRCGAQFLAVKPPRGRTPTYCDSECKRLAKNDKSAEWRRSDTKQPRTCQQCGAQWCNIPRPAAGRNGPVRFCDKPCLDAYRQGRAHFRNGGRPPAQRRRLPRRPSDKWISVVERWEIYRRDQMTCWLCDQPVDPDDFTVVERAGQEYYRFGSSYPTLDHVVPRSEGGGDDPSNLKTAHHWCNAKRGARPYSDFGGGVVRVGA